jgi:hypothetical protein
MALRCSAYQFNSKECSASCKTCWSAAQTSDRPSSCEAKNRLAKAPGPRFSGHKFLASCRPDISARAHFLDDRHGDMHVGRLGGQKHRSPTKTSSSGPRV